MRDDRQESAMESSPSDSERDIVGELIHAAGRRPTPPTEDYQQVFTASRDAWQKKVRSRQRRRLSYRLAAALATMAIGLIAVLQLVPLGPPVPIASTAVLEGGVIVLRPGAANWEPITDIQIELVSGTRLRTQVDGRVSLNLARGISLRVNSESELTLISPDHIDLAAGTVYVDSGRGVRTNRFEIATSFGVVRDIGTQFEVRLSPAVLRVRVREGLVQLYRDTDEHELSGTAGEEVQVLSTGAVERAPISAYDPEWIWAVTLADVPVTDGQPLLGFLSWVARETGRALRFAGPGAEAQAQTVILHGSAEDLSPMQALEVMLATTDFEYSLLNDGVLLIERRGLVR